MQTVTLERAYQALLARAREALATTPDADGQAENDWRLCHIALSDQIILAAVEATLRGGVAQVNNLPAMDRTAIASLVAGTTAAGRIALVQENAQGLMRALRNITDEMAGHPVRLIVYGRDEVHISTSELPWRELIDLRAKGHIPAHTAALRAGEPEA
jgi:hypothetical protein